MAKEFEPEFSQTDLTSTEKFMGSCKISIHNQQSRPMTFKAKVPYSIPPKNVMTDYTGVFLSPSDSIDIVREQ